MNIRQVTFLPTEAHQISKYKLYASCFSKLSYFLEDCPISDHQCDHSLRDSDNADCLSLTPGADGLWAGAAVQVEIQRIGGHAELVESGYEEVKSLVEGL